MKLIIQLSRMFINLALRVDLRIMDGGGGWTGAHATKLLISLRPSTLYFPSPDAIGCLILS